MTLRRLFALALTLALIASGSVVWAEGASAAGPHDAFGHLDAAGQQDIRFDPSSDTQTHVRGWGGDPDSGTTSGLTVLVYADGQLAASTYTHLARPDVAAAFPRLGGNTGFDIVLPLSLGTHSVCAWIVGRGPGSSGLLGCANPTVIYHNALQGHVDSITVNATDPQSVTFRGWVLDPLDTSGGPITASVEQGFAGVGGFVGATEFTLTDVTTGMPRPDVAMYYPHGGSSGFVVTFVGQPGRTGPPGAFASGSPVCLATVVSDNRFGAGARATSIAPVCTPFG